MSHETVFINQSDGQTSGDNAEKQQLREHPAGGQNSPGTPRRNLTHKMSSTISKDSKHQKISSWSQYMNYLHLFDLDYAIRAKTEAVFQDKANYIFDFFIADDQKFEQFYLYQNLWRETLLLNYFNDPRISKVKNFGQLPNKVVFREIQELKGISLTDYIENYIYQNQIDVRKFESQYTNSEV